ncbi:MAG TPA: pitrilysin family protein [Armatimonadota bacterium]|nr:pitrilysin family protein [Armatimonadota bacterium]
MFRSAMIVATTFALSTTALCGGNDPVVETLENGLRVLVVENHASPVVAVRAYVGTGSIYEDDLLGHGLSHYLEHTLSQGTPKRTQEEIDSLVESIGNSSNAYTSRDHCCYYITTATQYWQTALDIVGDYVFDPLLEEGECDIQKGVILREIARTNDDTNNNIYWLFAQTMFQHHPARYPVIGFPERFKTNTRDQLADYHAKWYVPDNVIMAVAGDVNADEVIEECRKLLGDIPRRPAPPVVLPSEPPQTAPRRRIEIDENLQRAYLRIGYRSIDLLHPDLYALDVLAYVLGNGASSRLVRIVREEKQLVDGISAYSSTPSFDAGAFGIGATLDPENLVAAEEAIIEVLEQSKTQFVTADELARAKRQKAAELTFARQTADDLASIAATDLLTTGNVHFSDLYVDKIREVTREDVRRVAQKYIDPDKLCVVAMTPKAPKVATRDTGANERPVTVTKTLDNGLQVLVQPSTTAPTVSIFAAMKGGLRYETEETNGVTGFMASMLNRGTKKRTREEVARAIEDMGASLSPYAGRNSFGVQGAALSEDLDELLELAGDALMNATFPEDQFEAQRRFTLAGIAAQDDSPETVARKLFTSTMYKVHPYRFMTSGTQESITNLTRETVADYYETYCRPNRAILCVFGDVDPDAAFAGVEKALGKWEPRQAQEPATSAEPELTEAREAAQDRDQEQSMIYMGFPGTKVDDERRYAIDVLDAVISGRGLPGGRLHDALRRRQLVYFVHAWNEAGLDPGAFVVLAATEASKTEEATTVIEEIIQGMRDEAVGDDELARGKQMCIAENGISLQTPDSRAQASGLDQLYGLGHDNYTRYADEIAKVTAADVQRVAQELLDLDRCVIAVVAPASEGAQE